MFLYWMKSLAAIPRLWHTVVSGPIWTNLVKNLNVIFSLKLFHMAKGEQGTAELVANAVLKQTNELCF